ncbi:MAG: hypothetical protein EOP85_10605 [Verrucomicrobiaceae bacterium]|nr:MAG: hypothetical protein EOP85_10605 [Verrucomicrobiaceae bacterium]
MSLENRLHLQSEDPDLLIEFDLPPGTHATIGASPKSEITLPLTGIPPFSCILGRFQDGRVFMANLDFTVARRVDLPDFFSIPPYQFALYHPDEPELVAPVEEPADGKPAPKKTRDQIATQIRNLFRKHSRRPVAEEIPVEAAPAPQEAVEEEPPVNKVP